jgi:hypothetical protein
MYIKQERILFRGPLVAQASSVSSVSFQARPPILSSARYAGPRVVPVCRVRLVSSRAIHRSAPCLDLNRTPDMDSGPGASHKTRAVLEENMLVPRKLYEELLVPFLAMDDSVYILVLLSVGLLGEELRAQNSSGDLRQRLCVRDVSHNQQPWTET